MNGCFAPWMCKGSAAACENTREARVRAGCGNRSQKGRRIIHWTICTKWHECSCISTVERRRASNRCHFPHRKSDPRFARTSGSKKPARRPQCNSRCGGPIQATGRTVRDGPGASAARWLNWTQRLRIFHIMKFFLLVGRLCLVRRLFARHLERRAKRLAGLLSWTRITHQIVQHRGTRVHCP